MKAPNNEACLKVKEAMDSITERIHNLRVCLRKERSFSLKRIDGELKKVVEEFREVSQLHCYVHSPPLAVIDLTIEDEETKRTGRILKLHSSSSSDSHVLQQTESSPRSSKSKRVKKRHHRSKAPENAKYATDDDTFSVNYEEMRYVEHKRELSSPESGSSSTECRRKIRHRRD
jgi:hypothetical protein